MGITETNQPHPEYDRAETQQRWRQYIQSTYATYDRSRTVQSRHESGEEHMGVTWAELLGKLNGDDSLLAKGLARQYVDKKMKSGRDIYYTHRGYLGK